MIFASALAVACAGDDDDDDDDDNATDDDTTDDDDDDDDTASDLKVTIVLGDDASSVVRLAAEDAATMMGQALGHTVTLASEADASDGAVNIVLDPTLAADGVFTSGEVSDIPAEGFRARRTTQGGAVEFVIAGADDRGTAYGLYDIVEAAGIHYFHPEQNYIPSTLVFPEEWDVNEAPGYGRRGFHWHTMHPTPHSEFLQRDRPDYLEYAKHLIDYTVRNKQNYMQWELLKTVDWDATKDHFRRIVDYAHERGVDVGIVVTWVFAQQKAWKLLPSTKEEHKEELHEGIDQLMEVPWDHIHLEMGSSEFTKVQDTLQVTWFNDTVEYLAEKYAPTDASVKIHVSSDQEAENYGDINFNFLPQFADPRLGVYPHTVQFYDLQGRAPSYGNDSFEFMYEWMLGRVGERKVYYYPESAYWVTFDINVPLYLPVYIPNRWNDIQLLKDAGIDGHVTFTSGHEFEYWLNDWTISRGLWDTSEDWKDMIGEFTSIFGPVGGDVKDIIIELAEHQEATLNDEDLIAYLCGLDTWDELGFLLGAATHVKPIRFKDVYAMSANELAEFQGDIVVKLENVAAKYDAFYERATELRGQVPEKAMPWFDEFVDSLAINKLRANHMFQLYVGATAARFLELGIDNGNPDAAAEAFDKALAITDEFLALMTIREQSFRYPKEMSTAWERSLTSYDYKYLWHAHTAYFYRRYEAQAIEKDFNPFLMNTIDVIWFFQ
ncbi:MAG: hypothetical protein H6684_09775 [Deltaproteobacteria bacterium]|nr:hypothetical protein [Deltaproteobacteria bacterium]